MEQDYCEMYSKVIDAILEGMAEAQESVVETRGYLHPNCHCNECAEYKRWLKIMDMYASIMDTTLYALKHLAMENEELDKDMEASIDADLVTGGNADLFEDDPYDGGCPADTR
jgi:hypothetical protein